MKTGAEVAGQYYVHFIPSFLEAEQHSSICFPNSISHILIHAYYFCCLIMISKRPTELQHSGWCFLK